MNEQLIYLKDIAPGKYGHVIKASNGRLEIYQAYRFVDGDLQIGYPSLILCGEELVNLIFLFGSIFFRNLMSK